MFKVTRRLGKLSGFIAAGVAMVATGSGVMAASYSTFSATNNAASNWNSGSLTLTNDSASSALFTSSTAALNGQKCIKVTSGGSYAGVVKLYSTGYTSPGTSPATLGEHINLTIEVGSAGGSGSFSTCSGFAPATGAPVFSNKLSVFNSTYGSYATGWDPQWTTSATAADARVFRITWTYDDTAPQSQTASDTFNWEAHTS